MKLKLFLIITLISLSGCAINTCGITENFDDISYQYIIDSTSVMYEDPNKPGDFLYSKDTIWIKITNTYNKKYIKTEYKIVKR